MSNDQTENSLCGQIDMLENLVRRLMNELADLEVTIRALADFEAIVANIDSAAGAPLSDRVHHFEVKLIRWALERTAGHQTRAADLLGIKMTTLNSMIKRYQLDPDEYALGTSRQVEEAAKEPSISHMKPEEKRRRSSKRARPTKKL